MKAQKLTALLLSAVSALGLYAQPSSRENFGKGWTFSSPTSPTDLEQLASPKDNSFKGRTVDIPHDWGVDGSFQQLYAGETGKLPWWGEASYRKNLSVGRDEIRKGKRFYLDVDGAMAYAKVYCNGEMVGERPYGYASFRVDLTPSIAEGSNTIEISLSNPDSSSRWYPGGGVYRNIWIVKADPVGIDHWGTAVTTPEVSREKATVVVTTTLRNDTGSPVKGKIMTSVEYGGKTIAKSERSIGNIVSLKEVSDTISVPSPKLWSPDTPELYTVTTTVSSEDGKYSDTVLSPLGIRTAEFFSDGFYLNGEKTFLKGVCLHHDAGALGAAWNESAWIRRLNMLKDMGCNAIRTSHNPPAPELLDLCDRMGFLVMDELTDTWTVPKKPYGYARIFDEWAEKDLVDLISRDRNHPSVIMWSIGNEVGEQGYADKWHIAQWLTDICHREDPTRPTTAGNDNLWASTQPYHNTIDVYGFNYKPHAYAAFHEENPAQPFLGSETASTISTRGYYLFPLDEKGNGQGEFQMSSYDLFFPPWATTPDREWMFEDQVPECAGEFVWTGFDYLGEPTPFNRDMTILTNFHSPEEIAQALKELEGKADMAMPSRSSYFGIIDLAGFPKDRYYLYQARWRPDLPMVHILPHWTWPGREGEVTPVHVYTSGDSAELFINGVSQGMKTKGEFEYRLRWDDAVYEPGTVKVIAYKNGQVWASEEISTAGVPEKVIATVETGHGPVEGFGGDKASSRVLKKDLLDASDLLFFDVKIADEKGNMVPGADNLVEISVKGPAVFVFSDAGDPTSHVSFHSPSLKAFGGLASFGVRKTGNGKARITVSSDGLKKSTFKIRFKDGKTTIKGPEGTVSVSL